MSIALGMLLIFCLRIVDVSLGTIKLLYMVRGQRTVTATLAFLESVTWLISMTLVFSELDNLWNMVAFTTGFAAGTFTGMSIERWIGAGHVLIRIMTRREEHDLFARLRAQGFGLTTVQAEGAEGPLRVVLLITKRKRTREALDLIKEVDPAAFVTVDPVSPTAGGYLLPTAVPSAIRK